MKARILSQYYAEAGLFVTKEQSRYSLYSLRIEPHPEKGVVVVATDGHTMGVFYDRGGECDADGVTLIFNSLLSEMCNSEKTLEVNDDGSASVLTKGYEIARFSDIQTNGKFPTWRDVLPNKNDVERNDYNPEYLERCAKAGRASYPHLAIWSGTDGKQVTNINERAAVVTVYERDDCFFLVMPMRQTNGVKYPELIEALRRKDHTDIEATPQAEQEVSVP
jgi:hypothetical protein